MFKKLATKDQVVVKKYVTKIVVKVFKLILHQFQKFWIECNGSKLFLTTSGLCLSQGLKEMWKTPEDVYQNGEVLNFYTGEGVGGQPKLSIFSLTLLHLQYLKEKHPTKTFLESYCSGKA